MKTIICTSLPKNSLLCLHFPFLEKKNKNQIFSTWRSGKEIISFLFLVSYPSSKACLIQQTFRKEVFEMLFLLVFSLMMRTNVRGHIYYT